MIESKINSKNDRNESFKQSLYAINSHMKFIPQTDTIDSINYQMNSNFQQIIQLLRQRKNLLIRKAQLIQNQHYAKIDLIQTAHFQEIKNQARKFEDSNLITLLQNADNKRNSKHLLQKISNEDLNTLEVSEKKKGKDYHDKVKLLNNNLCKYESFKIDDKNQKYKELTDSIDLFNNKQKKIIEEIQILELDMINILQMNKRSPQQIRKAQRLNEQIDIKKKEIKENRNFKDRKKKQIQYILKQIIDIIQKKHVLTNNRAQQIENLYGGNQNIQQFNIFFDNFEKVVESKLENKNTDTKSINKLIEFSNQYDIFCKDLNNFQQLQNKIYYGIKQEFDKSIKISLLEKTFLLDLPKDNNKLVQILKKCNMYRQLLSKFENDRIKIKKQIGKSYELQSFFIPQLKALESEELRKEELRKQLETIRSQQQRLQKIQKKMRDFELQANNYKLKKHALQVDLEQSALKGNLEDYKSKVRQLDEIELTMSSQQHNKNNAQFGEIKAKLDSQSHKIKQKYGSLIKQILVEKQMSTSVNFLNKLCKRLTLI